MLSTLLVVCLPGLQVPHRAAQGGPGADVQGPGLKACMLNTCASMSLELGLPVSRATPGHLSHEQENGQLVLAQLASKSSSCDSALSSFDYCEHCRWEDITTLNKRLASLLPAFIINPFSAMCGALFCTCPPFWCAPCHICICLTESPLYFRSPSLATFVR
jgi:hypothetical protein